MKWLANFFTSSLGQKLIMSLTGLFLILFLLVHLIGNLQLLQSDDGKAFNIYTHFMGHNPLIQLIAKGNYFFILTHAILGVVLAFKNKQAKGSKYAVTPKNGTTWASSNMALLGTLIFAFLLMHMGHFWFQFKFGSLNPTVDYNGVTYINAYQSVVAVMTNPVWMSLYLVGLLVLSFHLLHGFESAFQTLGLRHQKYTPIIKGLGKLYAILIPLGFAVLPLYIYFTQS
jgi:succinate dehydrogenase / fumarate reductase, cytochrome b subunit